MTKVIRVLLWIRLHTWNMLYMQCWQ